MTAVLEVMLKGAVLAFLMSACIGPVALVVIRLGLEKRFSTAVSVGAGAACVEGVQAFVAYLGVARLLTRTATVTSGLYLVAGVVLIVTALRPFRSADRSGASTPPEKPLKRAPAAFLHGGLLVAVNPAPLFAWMALAHVVFGDCPIPVAVFGAAGILCGVFAWFLFLIAVAVRLGGMHAVQKLLSTRAIDFLLAGIGIYCLVQGILGLL